jgi:4-hydroxybenzoate polyprenyltransferase
LGAVPDGYQPPPNAFVWGTIVFTAVFATAMAFLIQTWAQSIMDPSRVAIILTGEIVFAAAIAVAVGQEVLSARTIIGGVLIVVAMLIVGWSYNLGLKSNALSVLPYALGFGVLPIFVTLALEPSLVPPWWVMLAASLLGVSAHFANALPDLFQDRETGVRSLPHILGQRSSAFVIAASAASASLLVVTQSKSLDQGFAWVGFVVIMALALTASALALRAQPPRVIFHLLLGATFVNVVLLMLGQSLVSG